jgi:hypothetical protein
MATPWYIFAGRFQPFHSGHFWVVQQLVKTSAEVIIDVVNPEPERPPDPAYPSFHPFHNPFTFWERMQMIRTACASAKILDKIRIVPLEHPRTGLTAEAAYLPKDRVWVIPPLNEHERTKIVDFRRLGEEVMEIDVPSEYQFLSSTLLRACLYKRAKQFLQCSKAGPIACLPPGVDKVLSAATAQYRIETLVHAYPEFGAYQGYDCTRLAEITNPAQVTVVIETVASQASNLIDQYRQLLDRLIPDPGERAGKKQEVIVPLEASLHTATSRKDQKRLEEIVRDVTESVAQARRALAKKG